MNFVFISENNINLLKEFLLNAGNSLKSFRYYSKRDFDVIKNHLITYLILSDNIPVGYGHLDRDQINKKIWLGICVSEINNIKKCGKIMMEKLINYDINENIYLTVDKENKKAIKLFEKFDFKFEKEYSNDVLIMKRKYDPNL